MSQAFVSTCNNTVTLTVASMKLPEGLVHIFLEANVPCDDLHMRNMIVSEHTHPFTDAYAYYRKEELFNDPSCKPNTITRIMLELRDNALVREMIRHISMQDSQLKQAMVSNRHSVDWYRSSMIEYLAKNADFSDNYTE
jgi:hypothetical protein